MESVLRSASVERCFVSRMRDFSLTESAFRWPRCMCPCKTPFSKVWRPLFKGCIANIGLRWHNFSFFFMTIIFFWGGGFRASLLHTVCHPCVDNGGVSRGRAPPLQTIPPLKRHPPLDPLDIHFCCCWCYLKKKVNPTIFFLLLNFPPNFFLLIFTKKNWTQS